MISLINLYISTHILTKRMTGTHYISSWPGSISTHILTKRMTKLFNVFIAFSFISTHILTKRMTPTVYTVPLHFSHFNSHPHEEDDRRQEVIDYVINISTHILTKRMTLCVYTTICNIGISTHILTKRMTAILNKNNLLKIAYYISNKHFISIVDIFFHFHIYF